MKMSNVIDISLEEENKISDALLKLEKKYSKEGVHFILGSNTP